MYRRFAKIRYLPENEVSNALQIEKIELADENGFLASIPKDETFFAQAFDMLIDKNVEIISLPNGMIYDNPYKKHLIHADDNYLKAFLMHKIIRKAMNEKQKRIESSDIVIIMNNSNLTEMVIDSVYDKVNFLTILTDEPTGFLLEKADDILYESGLDIRILSKDKRYIKSADVVIDMSAQKTRLTDYYKHNSVYVDMTKCNENASRICSRRPDVCYVNKIKINYKNQLILLEDFELAFFVKCAEYRALRKMETGTEAGMGTRMGSRMGYTRELGIIIEEKLSRMDIKINSLNPFLSFSS